MISESIRLFELAKFEFSFKMINLRIIFFLSTLFDTTRLEKRNGLFFTEPFYGQHFVAAS